MQTSSYTSATIVDIHPMCLGSPIYRLILSPHAPLSQWSAGQFIMLQFVPLSRTHFARPFSIASVSSSTLTLYIHVRGNETKQVRLLKKGDVLSLWGPLGSSFSSPDTETLLIAGGIGIAPFVTYSNQYNTTMTLLFGHRIEQKHYPLDAISSTTTVRTFHDMNPSSLQCFLDEIKNAMLLHKQGRVLACGPLPLLRYIRSLAIEYDIDTELSVEETMFCGIGACLGCVCKATDTYPKEHYRGSYVQSCTQGPIFPAHSILI